MLIRTVDPCDKQCIADEFARLSPRSRHMRFFSPINKLSEVQLTYLIDVDNVNHVVIAAAETAVEDPAGIRLARYIRLKQEPDIAEFAITVNEGYRGGGVGLILLDCNRRQLHWGARAVDDDYATFGHMVVLLVFLVIVADYRALGNTHVLLKNAPAQLAVTPDVAVIKNHAPIDLGSGVDIDVAA